MSRMMGFIHDQVSAEGHAVDYLCADDVPAAARGRWGRLVFPMFVRGRAIEAARHAEPYDVINVHEPSGAAIVKARGAFGNSTVVAMCHSPERRNWDDLREEALRGRLANGDLALKTRIVYPLTSLWQSTLTLKYSDHVFCRNSYDRDYLARRFGLADKRMTVIFAGADERYASAAQPRDYRRASRLIFAGTWLKRKGVVDLVPAFSTLAQRHPDLTLDVVGAGQSESAIRESFPQAVRARVHCAPAGLSDGEHAAAFAEADVYIFPTLNEGGTLTLAEAMMSGLPIVTTDTCGMRDVIRDGENGLLVPIRSPQAIVNALERLLADPLLRERLGRMALRDAREKYTWQRVAAPMLDAYGRLRSQSR
jgi:glycosyltransferase involved in cell wall biosynthesis